MAGATNVIAKSVENTIQPVIGEYTLISKIETMESAPVIPARTITGVLFKGISTYIWLREYDGVRTKSCFLSSGKRANA